MTFSTSSRRRDTICMMMLWVGFCFQAEDGIRDLVRSRGLGDVYKRQGRRFDSCKSAGIMPYARQLCFAAARAPETRCRNAVSYTHLTLPTSDLV